MTGQAASWVIASRPVLDAVRDDAAGRTAVTGRAGFQREVRSSMRQQQNDHLKIISFFQKRLLEYAA
jgi:hypothetical protein